MSDVRLCAACGGKTIVIKSVVSIQGFRRTRCCQTCRDKYNTIETREDKCILQEVLPKQAEAAFILEEEEHYDEFGTPIPTV